MDFEITTFALELINFVVLTALLLRFVYRPIAASIDARRQALRESMDEAQQLKDAAARRNAELDERSRELDVLREGIFGEATAQAAKERTRLINEARADAAAERGRVHALLDAERETANAWVGEAAINQGADLAGRMLLRLAPDGTHQALMDQLLGELSGLEPRADGGVEPIEAGQLTLARHPAEGEVQGVEQALARQLGRRPALEVQVDPALGAGAILRLGHEVFDASMTGQLDAIRRDALRALSEA